MSIKLKVTGGLGNQMFQFAAGYSIAKKKKVDLHLDLSWFNRRDVHNGFELQNVFNIFEKVHFLKNSISSGKFSIKKFLNKFYTKYEIFDEPHFHYSSKILNISNQCFLRGYWQSESYFNEYIKDIKNIYKFNLILKDENLKLINDITNSKSVSLHIRRGDFLLKKNKNHLVDLNKYYSISINRVSKNLDNPKFFIFSDDPNWVYKNFPIKSNYKIINCNKGTNSFLDMYLMSQCKTNIIANSSFSWWGAWLNNNENKIIFAPKNWFNDKSINTNSLYPNTWNLV
jgi:hypothetical protein